MPLQTKKRFCFSSTVDFRRLRPIPGQSIKQKLKDDWKVRISLDSMGLGKTPLFLDLPGCENLPCRSILPSSTIFLINEDFVKKKLSDLSTQLRKGLFSVLIPRPSKPSKYKKKTFSAEQRKRPLVCRGRKLDDPEQDQVRKRIHRTVRAISQSNQNQRISSLCPGQQYLDENRFSSPGTPLIF